METSRLAITVEELCQQIRASARREEFQIDVPIYERFKKDPFQPILYAGSLQAPVCIFGHDLGKDEVRLGQPLIGAGGKLVRQGLVRAWQAEGSEEVDSTGELQVALRYALLTNTVPYKPPGNKAYSDPVKKHSGRSCSSFSPGSGADITSYLWAPRPFAGSSLTAIFKSFAHSGRSDARFDFVFPCRLPVAVNEGSRPEDKPVAVMPLPHPSPLNRRWLGEFPAMLARRLSQIRSEIGGAGL